MPTYNQAAYLPAALAGLDAQTLREFELIVCDDGSTDETTDILSSAGVRTVRHADNRGSAAAINSAAELATGDLMTWISSDNVMVPKWLATLSAQMRSHVGFVYSAFWYETEGHRAQEIYRPYRRDTLISDENCCIGPSFLIRADVWREAGPHTGKISHDLGHWLKVEEVCWRHGLEIVSIPTPLCHYRVHDQMAGRRLANQYDAPAHHAEARLRRA